MEVKPGWIKTKRSSLVEADTTEVAYIFQTPSGLWQVVADHRGVVIKGQSPTLSTDTQLDGFAWVLSDAMREFLKLKRHKISRLTEVTPTIPGN